MEQLFFCYNYVFFAFIPCLCRFCSISFEYSYKVAFLTADMWEVFYSESVNINRDVDEKARLFANVLILLTKCAERCIIKIEQRDRCRQIPTLCSEFTQC